MPRSSWLLAGTAALLAFAPTAVPAQHLSTPAARPELARAAETDARPRAASGYRTRLDGAWNAKSLDGCVHETRVRGAAIELAPRGEASRSGARYVPEDVRVDATVKCADGARGAVADRPVRASDALWRADLARAVEDAARVTVQRQGRACEYAPVVAIADGRLRGSGVAASCAAATTGGEVTRWKR